MYKSLININNICVNNICVNNICVNNICVNKEYIEMVINNKKI